jgi:hypothetical protein
MKTALTNAEGGENLIQLSPRNSGDYANLCSMEDGRLSQGIANASLLPLILAKPAENLTPAVSLPIS